MTIRVIELNRHMGITEMQYYYYINLHEREDFYADVRNSDNKTIYEIHGFFIFEDGFMSHEYDIDGLCSYLQNLGIIAEDDSIVMGE